MANTLPPNIHFQLRLVKEFKGKRIVTHKRLAKPKEGKANDQTLDLFLNEHSALQAARNYCTRGEKRKGVLSASFKGVVVVKHESDPSKWKTTTPGVFKSGFKLTKRPKRVTGTTIWRYYVSPECIVYEIDPASHIIIGPTKSR